MPTTYRIATVRLTTKQVLSMMSVDFFWRWEILLKWKPSKHVNVTLAYDVGDVQGFIFAAGGRNPRLLLASVQITLRSIPVLQTPNVK